MLKVQFKVVYGNLIRILTIEVENPVASDQVDAALDPLLEQVMEEFGLSDQTLLKVEPIPNFSKINKQYVLARILDKDPS